MNERKFTPSLEDGSSYLKNYHYLPITTKMLYDSSTLVNVFLSIKDAHKNALLLESVENGDKWGRYSFISYDPTEIIEVRDSRILHKIDGFEKEITGVNPLEYINNLLLANSSPKIDGTPKLAGGYIGYFSYDTVRYVENRLVNIPTDDLKIPDILLFKCTEIIGFDHLTHELSVTINIPTNGDYQENYLEGTKRADKIMEEITRFTYMNRGEKNIVEPIVRSNITKEEYIRNVEIAKKRIVEGDIFQVVLSNRFEVDNPPEAFNIYRMLRSTNPSPYMYFIQTENFSIAGASPEMLVNVEDGRITTKPIAGTIRRGKDVYEDKLMENKLINDEKEKAEHTMLVDLGRNDIGKVSKFGSVQVPQMMIIEKYSQLFHITSQVEGELREDMTLIDALKAVLPAGTLSGAPKVKAMEIIDELEKNKRCLYGGTIGYISFDGVMDTCIAIRTVLIKDNKAYIQAGAGVVQDSVPEKEYLECETKAKAMIKAIKEASKL